MLDNSAPEEGGRAQGSRLVRRMAALAMLFGAILALASLWQGFSNALNDSQDFQWSPSRLFALGKNPYQVYLDGNLRKDIILSQTPNYAQLTYLLLSPFGIIPFGVAKPAWALINVTLAIGCPLLAGKIFRLNSLQGLVVTIIFLMSTPVRNTIGNGQHSLLILAAFVCSLLLGKPAGTKPAGLRQKNMPMVKQVSSALLAGISYIKYSFAPTLGSAYYCRYGARYFLLSFAPVIIGALLFALWTKGNFFLADFWLQPVNVASQGVSPGAADLLSFLRLHLPGGGAGDKLSTLLCLLLAGGTPFLIRPNKNDLAWWSFCSIASLAFVTHLGYDYVFYLLPAVFAIKNLRSLSGLAAGALVSFPWFVSKALISTGIGSDVLVPLGLLINFLSLVIFWREMMVTAPSVQQE